MLDSLVRSSVASLQTRFGRPQLRNRRRRGALRACKASCGAAAGPGARQHLHREPCCGNLNPGLGSHTLTFFVQPSISAPGTIRNVLDFSWVVLPGIFIQVLLARTPLTSACGAARGASSSC